jgi:glucose/arabinose dehydrogenase
MATRRAWLVVLALFVIGCGTKAAAPGGATPSEGLAIRLESVASGLAAPIGLTQPDDETGRRFLIDQPGQIHILDEGGLIAEPFLDLSSQIVELDPNYDERGLLGLAFHPEYAENGRFFVYYSAELRQSAPAAWDHTSHISEFQVSEDSDRADPASERVILQIDQPYPNHNGGQIGFGPDGYLYIPLGDGGNGGDRDAEGDDLGRPEAGNAQTIETLLGSILRIDVDSGDPYAIPDDNVFAGEVAGADEIWAYGFRNPYGMSFDLETGAVYVADAGQARYEEIDLVEPGGNHGWNIKEGTHCFDPDDFLNPPAECPDGGTRGEPLVDPIIEYERGPESGSVVVPGVRYRGDDLPSLEGKMLFADYASIRFLPTGVLYAATPESEGLWPVERVSVEASSDQPSDLDRFVLGVYQDLDGDMYLMTSQQGGPSGTTGEVFAIVGAEANSGTGWVWVAAAIALGVLLVALAVFAARRSSPTEETGL